MYVVCQAGAHEAHSVAGLLPFAIFATEVAVRRGAFPLHADDGKAFAALFAADTPFFHGVLLFVIGRRVVPCPPLSCTGDILP